MKENEHYKNRLAQEKSPYLQNNTPIIRLIGSLGGKRPLTRHITKTNSYSYPLAIPHAIGAMSWPTNPSRT